MEELALHILDIAQNSIEAGATRIRLSLIEDLPSDKLTIRISDNGRRLRSRRLRPDLKALAVATEACAGSFQVESRKGLGTTVIATFQHSHIDCAPLGDIKSALLSIILFAPEVNLRCSHRVDGGGSSSTRRRRAANWRMCPSRTRRCGSSRPSSYPKGRKGWRKGDKG